MVNLFLEEYISRLVSVACAYSLGKLLYLFLQYKLGHPTVIGCSGSIVCDSVEFYQLC